MKIVASTPVKKPLSEVKEGECFKIWDLIAIRIYSDRGAIKIASLEDGMTWTFYTEEGKREMVELVKAHIEIE